MATYGSRGFNDLFVSGLKITSFESSCGVAPGSNGLTSQIDCPWNGVEMPPLLTVVRSELKFISTTTITTTTLYIQYTYIQFTIQVVEKRVK